MHILPIFLFSPVRGKKTVEAPGVIRVPGLMREEKVEGEGGGGWRGWGGVLIIMKPIEYQAHHQRSGSPSC